MRRDAFKCGGRVSDIGCESLPAYILFMDDITAERHAPAPHARHTWIEKTSYGRRLAAAISEGVRPLLRKFGVDLVRYHPFPLDFDEGHRAICAEVKPFTMTGYDRLHALIEAVRYTVRNGIDGAYVECGVWRGGSVMAIIRALQREAITDRDVFLYDTFEGMNAPGAEDVSVHGKPAEEELRETTRAEGANIWCLSPLEDVQTNVLRMGYPRERIHFVKGLVEETIPGTMPDRIALLRLDTDWYESTRHELEFLFPLLAPGGVLIIDDYGHWLGQRKAVDEYIAAHGLSMFMHRIDYTSRLLIKPG